jgi:hypothetical protein
MEIFTAMAYSTSTRLRDWEEIEELIQFIANVRCAKKEWLLIERDRLLVLSQLRQQGREEPEMPVKEKRIKTELKMLQTYLNPRDTETE